MTYLFLFHVTKKELRFFHSLITKYIENASSQTWCEEALGSGHFTKKLTLL